MAIKQRKRVLYFVKGRQPTEEQVDRALKMAEDVVFRNASMVKPEDKVEACDAVMGFVPKQYKDAEIPVISIKKQADSGEKGGDTTKTPTTATKPATGAEAKS